MVIWFLLLGDVERDMLIGDVGGIGEEVTEKAGQSHHSH